MFKIKTQGDDTRNADGKEEKEKLPKDASSGSDATELIGNIRSFYERDARDIMTHRSDIKALDGTMSLGDAVGEILKSGCSRFPVYEGNLDAVLGILTFKDAMRVFILQKEKREMSVFALPDLIREVPIIPETRKIAGLLNYMRERKVQIAMVVDEYGQVSGLLTVEDILEELVGDILDEYDSEDSYIQQQYDNSIVMDGATPLERAGEVLGYDFSGEQFETLNGYLTNLLGHIPTEKDRSVVGKKYLFHILKTENHTIRKVRAERLPEKAEN